MKILAKEIQSCNQCPLCQEDCVGGLSTSPTGSIIEPPCECWEDDTEVYSGMYVENESLDYLPNVKYFEELKKLNEKIFTDDEQSNKNYRDNKEGIVIVWE